VRVHLVNPSDVSFGTAVITPRWQYVLAGATPRHFGTPVIVDETVETFDVETVAAGDVVGIGIHTANALRGYQIGQRVRARGAYTVFGGIHASLYPDEVRQHGAAHAVVTGDGDLIWSTTKESLGAKFRGSAADVADKVVKQLIADMEAIRNPQSQLNSNRLPR